MGKSSVRFIKQFMANPREVGALLPSSPNLGRAMLHGIHQRPLRYAVEYGPGTGSFTKLAVHALPASCQLILVEKNRDFVAGLRKTYPHLLIIDDDAAHINQHLGPLVGHIDFIYSGLPFTNFPKVVNERIIHETYLALAKGGHFRTFIYAHNFYLPKIQRFLSLLQKQFSQVTYRPVMKNFPPAMVIDCVK